MDFFTQTFQELPDYDRLCRAIDGGETPVCVTGLSPVHKAQLTLTLSTRGSEPILLLTGTEADAVRLAADINGMAGAEVAAQLGFQIHAQMRVVVPTMLVGFL